MQASLLVKKMLPALTQAGRRAPVLDLACGGGRNGIYLVRQGIPVVFADQKQTVLDDIARQLKGCRLASYWTVDFEKPRARPLHGHSFGAILAFRYLHRPLFDAIKTAVSPGGLVIYETYTVAQREHGRPRSPQFLLLEGELEAIFGDWQIMHSFEGVTRSETGDKKQAIAQIVARRV